MLKKSHLHLHPSRFDTNGNPLAPTIMGLDEFYAELKNCSIPNFAFDSEKHFKVIVLDTETTGVEDDDEIIELAMLDLYFEKKTRKFLSAGLLTDELREPVKSAKKQLSPVIVKLTGLTEEDLKGKNIDAASVLERLKSADIVVAHNVKFDRKMLDRFLNSDEINDVLFGCSLNCIDWTGEGEFLSAKQELLLLFHGVLFRGHRANTDIMGLAWLLVKFDYIGMIIDNLKIKHCYVEATKADFSAKGHLRKFGFEWGGDDNKVWHNTLPLDDFKSNKKEWTDTVYGPSGSFTMIEISPKQRFSTEHQRPKGSKK